MKTEQNLGWLSRLGWLFAALGLAACGAAPPAQLPSETPGAQSEETAPKKILLGRYRATATPGDTAFALQALPVTSISELPASIAKITAGLANGDESVQASWQTQFTMANCSEGVCGCTASSTFPDISDLPQWRSGDCTSPASYTNVATGNVVLTNAPSDVTFVNPAAVFANCQPNSCDPPDSGTAPEGVHFFSALPFSFLGTCSSFQQTRSASPYAGHYYVGYGDVGPGGCSKGSGGSNEGAWIAAMGASGYFSFDIFVFVDSLVASQVLNGNFESGLSNWTTEGSVAAISEYCSFEASFACGVSDVGIPAPEGSTMARLLTIDGGSTSGAYSARITSSGFSLQAGEPSLSFSYKMGSREGAAFCGSLRNDEVFVEARANGGSWITVPLPDPPDVSGDDDDRIGTGIGNSDDCSVFQSIGLSAVFESSWEPGSSSSPNDFQTITADLTAAPFNFSANDTVEVRFTVLSGNPTPQLGVSTLLVDSVQMVP